MEEKSVTSMPWDEEEMKKERKIEHVKVVEDALLNWCIAVRIRHDSLDYANAVNEMEDVFDGISSDMLPRGDPTTWDVKEFEEKFGKKNTLLLQKSVRIVRKQREFENMPTEDLRDLLKTEHHSVVWNAFQPFYDECEQLEHDLDSDFKEKLKILCQSLDPKNINLAPQIISLTHCHSWKQLAECSRWEILEIEGLDRTTADKILCIATMFAHNTLIQTIKPLLN